MPNIIAKGGRGAAYEAFKFRHLKRRAGDFVAMMIDSEEPLAQLEATWPHLKQRDQWARPAGAIDDQVLFMTTCMETWIVSDRVSLKKHFGQHLKEKGLTPLDGLEKRGRHDVQDALIKATRSCPNAYQKGERSYAILGRVGPCRPQGAPTQLPPSGADSRSQAMSAKDIGKLTHQDIGQMDSCAHVRGARQAGGRQSDDWSDPLFEEERGDRQILGFARQQAVVRVALSGLPAHRGRAAAGTGARAAADRCSGYCARRRPNLARDRS